jgi:hypothetical protein
VIDDLDKILKLAKVIYSVVPSALLTIISLYFCYKKIFHKIDIDFFEMLGGFTKPRIYKIILYNRKNRVEIILSISIITNDKIKYDIIRRSVPLILKPLECIEIDIPEVSEYFLNNKPMEYPEFTSRKDFFFEIRTLENKIKFRPKSFTWKKCWKQVLKQRKYKEMVADRKYYNGIVIDETILYSVLYVWNNIHKTTFIDKYGVIRGECDFYIGAIPENILNDKDKILAFLSDVGIKYHMENITIEKIEYDKIKYGYNLA